MQATSGLLTLNAICCCPWARGARECREVRLYGSGSVLALFTFSLCLSRSVSACLQVQSVEDVGKSTINSWPQRNKWPSVFLPTCFIHSCTVSERMANLLSHLQQKEHKIKVFWLSGFGSKLHLSAQCQTKPRLPHLAANRFNLISSSIYLVITLALLSHDTPLFLFWSLPLFLFFTVRTPFCTITFVHFRHYL